MSVSPCPGSAPDQEWVHLPCLLRPLIWTRAPVLPVLPWPWWAVSKALLAGCWSDLSQGWVYLCISGKSSTEVTGCPPQGITWVPLLNWCPQPRIINVVFLFFLLLISTPWGDSWRHLNTLCRLKSSLKNLLPPSFFHFHLSHIYLPFINMFDALDCFFKS